MRRVLSRHSSSGPNNALVCGLSRRKKVKRLSEGTMSSDVDGELTRRKFKLPKKGFCDSIPVHPASVPRKLRSAISKRSCKSASVPLPDSKSLKHSLNDVASLRKDCLKKSKTSMYDSDSSPRLTFSVPISKEEEEVAETLFALAGMVSLNGESSEAKTQGLARNNHNDPSPLSLGPVIQKEDHGTAKPLIETSPLNWPKLSERRQLDRDLKVSVPPVHLQRIPSFLRTCGERQLADSTTISQISTAPIWQRGVDDTNIEKVSFPLWQSQHFVDPRAVDLVASQRREQDTSLERRNPLRGIGLDGLPVKSSAILFPSWVNATASSSRPGTRGDSVSADKVSSSINGTMKSRKRCTTHVYISILIQGMQISEGKDRWPLLTCQSQPTQSSSIAPDQNDLSGALTSHMFGSRVPMNFEHRNNKDDGSKKQSFDFLALSTGVAPKANTGATRLDNCLESKGHGPHLHPVSQASVSLPCSTPQNCLPSKAYRNQVAVASMAMPPLPPQVQLQMPQYFANAFNPSHMSHTGNAKPTRHTQPKSEQQQQEIWSSQLAAQFRPGPLFSSHIANWQTRTQDPRISTQPIPPSQLSLEAIGAKYLHISQHQQQMIGLCPPLPLSTAKTQTRLAGLGP